MTGTLLAGVLLALCQLALQANVSVKDGVTVYTKKRCLPVRSNRTIYDFEAGHINGRSDIDFNVFRGKQEPGANGTEIMNTIKYVRPGHGFIPHFPLTKKMDVNGLGEHPLWTYLKEYCPPTMDGWARINKVFQQPYRNNDVRWNFEKFLIDQRGYPFMRYDASSEPITYITRDIENLLKHPYSTPPFGEDDDD